MIQFHINKFTLKGDYMIKLSDHFDYGRLIGFTYPTIGVLVIMSVYSVVDGFFVANFVSTSAFAAVNFVMPVLLLLGYVGLLFGEGGGALIGKTLGEKNSAKANRIFSMLIYLSAVLGIFFAIFGITFVDDILEFLGAEGELLEQSITYGQIVLIALPMYILNLEFLCFAATAGKPKFGFYVSLATGLTNIFLDALFIVVFGWGLEGAAVATLISQAVGGILPLIYFSKKNSSLLRLTTATLDIEALIQTCFNGVSELISSVSMSIVSMLYNWQLLKYAGESGVAAFGILMYVAFIFEGVYVGYSMGIEPVVSYHYGAKNYKELKSLLRKSLKLLAVVSIVTFLIAEIFARPLAQIFASADENLFEMTVHAFRIYSFAFLIESFSLFASAFFTALNNGLISAVIAGLRTLVFEVFAVLTFPLIFGLNGIWFSMVGANIMALIVSAVLLKRYQRTYKY